MKLLAKFKDKENLSSPARVYKGLKSSNWGKKEWSRLALFLLLFGGIGYLTFRSFAATTNIAHPDGSLITFSGHVYIVEGGQKRPVTSEDALYSNGYSFANVVPANDADNNLPNGPNFNIRAGTLVMSADTGNPSVWIVVDGGNGNYTKWGIPNQTVFNDDLHYNYGNVMRVVSDAELPPTDPNNLITGANHAGGQFIEGTDGIIYMVGNAGKYRVLDPSVDATYSSPYMPLYPATAGDMALPTLGFLPYHEGSIVNSPGTGMVYMMGCADTGGVQGVCNMQKHWFTDPTTMSNLGYSTSQAVGGSDAALNTIPTGYSINAPTVATPPPPPATPSGGVAPTGFMDVPAATTSGPPPLLNVGSTVSGWAADKDGAINGVQLYIDDKIMPGLNNGTLNGSDQSVCNAHSDLVNCANSGWSFVLSAENLAGLAPGTHTIHFVATDKDTPTPHSYVGTDRNFTLGNSQPGDTPITNPVPPPAPTPTPSPNPSPPPSGSTGTAPTGYLDQPASTAYPYPLLSVGSTVSGWAADKETAIHGVQVYIDDKLMQGGANATTINAPNASEKVCTAHPGYYNCATSGWQLTLTAANVKGLAIGTHLIHFVATDSDSPTAHTYKSAERNFTFGTSTPTDPPITTPLPPPTSPGSSPTSPICLPRDSECNPSAKWLKPDGNIDKPAAGSKVGGVVAVSGWALDNKTTKETAISDISVSIDGHYQDDITDRHRPADACNTYASRVGCPNVGWLWNWNSAAWPNGNHEIEITIVDSDPTGSHSRTLTRVVATDNQLPPSGDITSPLTSSKNPAKVTGKVLLTGYAFDNKVRPEHAIQSVAISINNSFIGYADYGQAVDSEDAVLCHQYGSPPGCSAKGADIGWDFHLDTTPYPAGTRFEVEVTITDKDSPPSSTTITAPYISANKAPAVCPPGYTGTPPKCQLIQTPPTKTATKKFMVAYAYPSDIQPNQREISGIPTAISTFQTYLKTQTSKKNSSGQPVFAGAPNGMLLNISSTIDRQIKLPRTTAQYVAAARNRQPAGWTGGIYGYTGDIIDQLDGDVGVSTANDTKWLIFFDGTFPDAFCGVGGGSYANMLVHASQWSGNPKTPEITCEDTSSSQYTGGPMPGSFFNNIAPLHEVIHTFGEISSCEPDFARSTKDDPSWRPGDVQGHVSETNDLMYWEVDSGAQLDVNNNDYFGSNLAPNCLGLTSPSTLAYFNIL